MVKLVRADRDETCYPLPVCGKGGEFIRRCKLLPVIAFDAVRRE